MRDSADSSPFEDAAPYYDAHRAPYAPAALDYIVAAFGLSAGSRVLDLGCGPGTIAIPLSRTGAEVLAVDCDAAMLNEGRRLAVDRGAGCIDWRIGRAEDLLPGLRGFHLAILGQSLHWMDRDLVLSQLAEAIEDGGALVIFDEGRRRPQESWDPVALRVVAKYLGHRGRHPLKHPESAHAPSLARSRCFASFTVREFPFAIIRDLASILGCVYSAVSATRPMFGGRVAAFEAELSEALLRLEPSGLFEERIETAVYIAPKGPPP
jgi:SAM-dependent methyltransferase